MPAAQVLNLSIVIGYLLLIVGVGTWISLKRKTSDQFMTANRTIPGWAVGLSMFGSYISSISFLGNPAASFKGNWMWAGFTLVTPLGLLVGSTLFMRFYRHSGHVSAYTHLEHRFGPWARTYAVFTYLILQMARMGTILYLLAQAVLPLMGGHAHDLWTARCIIIAIGLLMTVYTLFGGIEAVVWTGVIQSLTLICGPIVCLATLLLKMPGGLGQVIQIATAHDKFSFGPYSADLATPTFWLVVLTALLEHLRNWGIDQSYVQRYISAPSDQQAARSIWIAGLLYMPVAFFFWFIGTALFAYYTAMPGQLPAGIAADSVFPHFISHELLPGLSGLVVAAIFAASMDSNLNAMATLTLVDGYKRYLRPDASDRESLRVLHISTGFWGLASIGYALMMTLKGATTTIEFSAKVGGLLAGGLVGLFFLGLIWRRVNSASALVATIAGVLVIVWMSLSRWSAWPQRWDAWRSPFHEMLAGIAGTAVVVLVGLALAALRPARRKEQAPTTLARDH